MSNLGYELRKFIRYDKKVNNGQIFIIIRILIIYFIKRINKLNYFIWNIVIF